MHRIYRFFWAATLTTALLIPTLYADNSYYVRGDFAFGESTLKGLNLLESRDVAGSKVLNSNLAKTQQDNSLFQYGIFGGVSIFNAPVPVLIGFGVLDTSSGHFDSPALFQPPTNFTARPYDANVSSQAFFATLQLNFFQYNWRNMAFIAFAGGGAGVTYNKTDANIISTVGAPIIIIDKLPSTVHSNDFAYYLDVGLEWKLTNCFGLAGGYQYTDLGYARMGDFYTNQSSIGDLKLQANHFYVHSGFVRVSYYFPSPATPSLPEPSMLTEKDTPLTPVGQTHSRSVKHRTISYKHAHSRTRIT